MNLRVAVIASALLSLTGCASIGKVIAALPSASSPLSSGFRIVSPANVSEVNADQLLAALTRADVVFDGEQHDDPETHRATRAR